MPMASLPVSAASSNTARIAEAAFAANPGLLHADVGALHAAMTAVLRAAGPERQLVVCAPIRTLPESWRWRVS